MRRSGRRWRRGYGNQGRVTTNFLILMALGGAIAVVGLVSDPVPQVTAFVAASIIAPGFEPIVKIPLGLVLRRGNVVRRGLIASAVGYLVLIGVAALVFFLFRLTGTVTGDELVDNREVERLAHPGTLDLVVSACGAAAGVTMVVAYRRSVIAGPLIALAFVPAAALVGAALVIGRWTLLLDGMKRLAIDAALLIVLGALVIAVKQVTVHRRAPLV